MKKFEDMPGIGDVSREGRVGVQVKVIRVQRTANGGRQIILLTDRPIQFWEAAQGSATVNYPYGMIRLTINDRGEGKGEPFPIVKVNSISATAIDIDDYGLVPIQLGVHQIK